MAMTTQNPSSIPVLAAPGRPSRARAASWGFGLSLLALLGGVVAMGAVGATLAPMEAASGYYFGDTPAEYRWAVLAAFASLLLWSAAGIAGLVLGLVGLRGGRGRTRAVWAIVLAVLAPVLSVAVLVGAMTVGAALL